MADLIVSAPITGKAMLSPVLARVSYEIDGLPGPSILAAWAKNAAFGGLAAARQWAAFLAEEIERAEHELAQFS